MLLSAMRRTNVCCVVYLSNVLIKQVFSFIQTFIINTLLEKLPEFMLDGLVFHMSSLRSILAIFTGVFTLSYFV